MAAPESTQDRPSPSAYVVAVLRAQHQLVEGGSIFPDPLAIAITGQSPENIAQGAREYAQFALLRLFIAARSRFAEDCLAKAVDRGVRQIVLLGAGLDTFALRNPYAGKGVRVFEVDRLATQLWKRQFLDKANLTIPPSLSFVAVDFEKESFLSQLSLAGFSTRDPAFFIWLGVVVYLSRKAITAALSAIATIPEAEVVFDYAEPPESVAQVHRARYLALIARAKATGEPWLSVFSAADMAAGLSKLGFSEIEDLGSDAIAARYLHDELAGGGGHIVRARRVGPQASLNIVSSSG